MIFYLEIDDRMEDNKSEGGKSTTYEYGNNQHIERMSAGVAEPVEPTAGLSMKTALWRIDES
jgi:hypothetical protein